jgi:hypothetical protein
MASGISTRSSLTPSTRQLAACGSTSNLVSGGLLVDGREKMALYRVGYQDRYGCYQECPFTPTEGMLNIDKAKAIVARWREAGYTIIEPMLWMVGDNGRAICPCPNLDA